jgi:ADP-heptose:LPS heptosyltransferase
MKHTLLLNWIYYRPVGHAVEAMAAAADYAAANPDLEIHVLLNDRTPVELADYCPWVRRAYAIDVEQVAADGQAAACLKDLPRAWDYIVSSERLLHNYPSYSQALLRCHAVIDALTTARIWRGIRGDVRQASQEAPGYIYQAAFRMEPPQKARKWAQRFSYQSPICAALLGGSSPEPIYPSIEGWIRLFNQISHAFPSIHFLVVGASDSSRGRSTTHGITREELGALFEAIPNATDCYDVGLPNQLALLELADFFLSPHTGFAFLAPSVGTPWLAVSGARWPDTNFARMPFYAALPDCPEYPCFEGMLPDCSDRLAQGIRVECMAAGFDERIEQLVAGARLLMTPGFDLAAAIQAYQVQAELKGVNRERLYTLDMLKALSSTGE